MVGIEQSQLDALLTRVAPEFDQAPVKALDLAAVLGPRVCEYVEAYWEGEKTLEKSLTELPWAAFRRLSADDLSKIITVSVYMADGVEKEIKASPSLRLIRKIQNCIWRWGLKSAGWNETVATYEGMRCFDLGVPGFSVTLDHTTSVNERGRGEHSRTYLDGVFAFLVHYKGEHVMTIGFSVSNGNRLMIQQVQTVSRKGNRWMFKLPANRLEFLIERFSAAFPEHCIYVANGNDLAKTNLATYRRGIAEARRRLEMHAETADMSDSSRERRVELLESIEDMKKRIAHLRGDRARLAAFYENVGRYTLGQSIKINDIRHHLVVPAQEQAVPQITALAA